MLVFFSLEGVKPQLTIRTAIEPGLTEREQQLQTGSAEADRLLWEKEPETGWANLDHLL